MFCWEPGFHGEKGFLHNCPPFPYVPIFFRPLTLHAKHTSSDKSMLRRGIPLKEMASEHGFAEALFLTTEHIVIFYLLRKPEGFSDA